MPAMGVRRYGAHGLSYESIVYQAGAAVPKRSSLSRILEMVRQSRPSERTGPRHLDGPYASWRHHKRHTHR